MLCKRCHSEFTPSKGFVNYCSSKCRLSPNSVRAGWNKGIKSPEQSRRMSEDNPIHKWAKRDPEGFRKEQSRKTVISNKKHPRGGWIGGYPGFNDKEWVEFNGAFVTKEFLNAMTEEQNGL